MTDRNIRRFAFLWDTWTHQFLICCSPAAPPGTIPVDWFSLDDPRIADRVPPRSFGFLSEEMPPLTSLAAYLQIFNRLDSRDTDTVRMPQISGTAENDGGEWRRVRHVQEEVATAEELTPEEEEEVHEDIRCGICHDKPISIQFRECTHALCGDCNDSYWWSILSRDSSQGMDPSNTLRLSFPCHMCRAEVFHEGYLVPDSSPPVETRHGDFGFRVEGWHLVALKPEFQFHRVFLVNIEQYGERVTAEPFLRSRERLVPVVDGERLSRTWDLYVAYGLVVLRALIEADSV
jgi:hypothetical protein